MIEEEVVEQKGEVDPDSSANKTAAGCAISLWLVTFLPLAIFMGILKQISGPGRSGGLLLYFILMAFVFGGLKSHVDRKNVRAGKQESDVAPRIAGWLWGGHRYSSALGCLVQLKQRTADSIWPSMPSRRISMETAQLPLHTGRSHACRPCR